MPYLTTNDEVKLYYEDTGAGRRFCSFTNFPRLSCLELQVVISPGAIDALPIMREAILHPRCRIGREYSQQRAIDDAWTCLTASASDKAHVAGFQGRIAALQFGIHYPERPISIVVGAAGMARADKTAQSSGRGRGVAGAGKTEGAEKFAPVYGPDPGREQLELKDRAGSRNHRAALAAFSKGAALTCAGVQARRPSPFELVAQLEKMMCPRCHYGDEDRSCLGPGAFLKRRFRRPADGFFPRPVTPSTWKEPALFNSRCRTSSLRWRAAVGCCATSGPRRRLSSDPVRSSPPPKSPAALWLRWYGR